MAYRAAGRFATTVLDAACLGTWQRLTRGPDTCPVASIGRHMPPGHKPLANRRPLNAGHWPTRATRARSPLCLFTLSNQPADYTASPSQVRDCNDGWLDSTTVTSVACDADCGHEVRTRCHSMCPMRQRHDILSPCGASVQHAVAAKIANHNGATSGQHSNPQRDGTAAMDGSTVEQVRTPCNPIRTMCHSTTP